MGCVGRAGTLLSVPEGFNEGSSRGTCGSRAHPRSRPHGKRSCLLRSSDFKEQKGQLVVLQLGKRQLFPADRPLAYKNGILIGPQPPPAHPLAPWLIPQGAAAQTCRWKCCQGAWSLFREHRDCGQPATGNCSGQKEGIFLPWRVPKTGRILSGLPSATVWV